MAEIIDKLKQRGAELLKKLKDILLFKGVSAPDIATVCWGGIIIFAGFGVEITRIIIYPDCKADPANALAMCVFFAFLFLIQLFTAKFLGRCYEETDLPLHRRILILLGILHGILILLDCSLFLWLEIETVLLYILLTTLLFFLTGVYLMILRHFLNGLVVISFCLIGWCQPFFFLACRQ